MTDLWDSRERPWVQGGDAALAPGACAANTRTCIPPQLSLSPLQQRNFIIYETENKINFALLPTINTYKHWSSVDGLSDRALHIRIEALRFILLFCTTICAKRYWFYLILILFLNLISLWLLLLPQVTHFV